MRMLRPWYGIAAAMVLVAGCYVEQTKDEAQDAQKRKKSAGETGLGLDQDAATCRFALGKGCFDGHAAARTPFYIEGKQFFNADDLATRFKELLNIQADGKKLSEGKGGYELKLLTALDNNSFIQGFTYELFNGPTPRTGNLRTDGNFSVDDLAPGTYDLRIGKAVKFTLTPLAEAGSGDPGAGTIPPAPPTPPTHTSDAPAQPTPPNPRDTPAQPTKPTTGQPSTPAAGSHGVTKVYCATVYADTTINVHPGQRLWYTLAEFRLHITDDQCMNGGNQTVINL